MPDTYDHAGDAERAKRQRSDTVKPTSTGEVRFTFTAEDYGSVVELCLEGRGTVLELRHGDQLLLRDELGLFKVGSLRFKPGVLVVEPRDTVEVVATGIESEADACRLTFDADLG